MNLCPKLIAALTARVLLVTTCAPVNAVFSGHEHVYERLTRKDGIHYFILGNSAKLMTHDFRSKQDMEVEVDTERAFMIVEIAGDTFHLAYRADNGFGDGSAAVRVS